MMTNLDLHLSSYPGGEKQYYIDQTTLAKMRGLLASGSMTSGGGSWYPKMKGEHQEIVDAQGHQVMRPDVNREGNDSYFEIEFATTAHMEFILYSQMFAATFNRYALWVEYCTAQSSLFELRK